jgi:hypothetical protein
MPVFNTALAINAASMATTVNQLNMDMAQVFITLSPS